MRGGRPRDGCPTASGEAVTVHSENKFAKEGKLPGTPGTEVCRPHLYLRPLERERGHHLGEKRL